ncbi:MAG: Hpt domain-containing protein, partial [Rhizobiales bacterium]|nr:Hpt domain-containing protein [Hyphomicrobiales bacterium]
MDDLLLEFLMESSESLDVVDAELVKFEQEPNNSDILGNIFRLVHTIKGTCGFLDLPRLEALAHAAETLMGKFRDGAPVTPESVSVILKSIDRIKDLLGELETRQGAEPEGNDYDLIAQLEVLSGLKGDPNSIAQQAIAAAGGTVEIAAARAVPEPTPEPEPAEIVAAPQERDTKPGEVSLDELERLFQEAPGLDGFDATAAAKEAAVESVSSDDDVSAPEAPAEIVAEAPAPAPEPVAKAKPKKEAKAKVDKPAENKGAPVSQQTIRVSVEALEQLMTMVSELVLTRNQLLEIARTNDDI